MYEIHAFTATAVATAACSGAFRPGDRHALLAFLRQFKGAEHDWPAVEGWIKQAGWRDIKFERGGTILPENLSGKADYLVRAFETAMQEEFGFVAYDEVLPQDIDE